MEPAAVLAVIVKAQGIAEANAQLASVQKTLEKTDLAGTRLASKMEQTGARMTSAGKMMTKGLTVPIVGIAVASADLSAKFHRSMNLIITDAGGTRKELKYLSKDVLNLAKHSEFGPQKLADSLFFIESAGVRGGKAIKDLDKIQKAAMAGNAELEQAVFGTVGAMNALGKEGQNVEKILALMNTVVGHGHMRLDELTAAMKTGTLGVAHTFGVTFEGFGSAIAFFTRMSEPAQQAATRLRQTITHLASSSTKKSEEALASIGISAEHMGIQIKKTGKLGPVFKELQAHLKGLSIGRKNQVLTEAFGGGRFGTQIREAIDNLSLFLRTEREIKKTGTIKLLRQHEKEMAEQASVKLKEMWSNIQVFLIKIGDAVLPVLVPVLQKVINFLGGVTGAFTHLSHGGQEFVVVAALILAAMGPLLIIFGSLVRAGASVVMLLQKIGGWFINTTTETDATVVANDSLVASYGELAASIEAVTATYGDLAAAAETAAAAQGASGASGAVAETGQMSMMMPEASSAGQLSLLGTNAGAMSAEAETAGVAAGGVAAGGLATGLAAALPLAIAGAGVINILSSVLGGDSKGAMFKVGGAAAGAIAGGLIGGLPGALIGGGIGSIIGGIIGKAYGPHITKLQETVRAQASHAQDAMKSQRSAINDLVAAEDKLTASNKRHHASTKRVTQAHHELNHAIRQFGPDSHQARQSELALARAQHKDAASAHEAKQAHQLAGHALKLYRHETVIAVASEKQRLPALDAQVKHLAKKYHSEENNYALLKRLVKKESTEAQVRKKIAETVAEAGQKAGKKFAQGLEAMSPAGATFGKHLQGLESRFQTLPKVVHSSTEKTIKSWEGMADVFHTKTTHGKEDIRSWYKATDTGVELIKGNLQKFAKELGISKVQFHAGTKGKAKRQTGGMVVPGAGTGDKVPLTAMVEPGEVVHVLNMRASKDRHKLGALETLNNQVPRFQEGGTAGVTSAALAEAQKINSEGFEYKWGGGHGSFAGPYDCSGAVSAVLHAAGLLDRPMVSGELASYGAAGPGPITIYANGVHAFMSIMGKFFGTSESNPGGGAGFFPTSLGKAEAGGGDSGGAFQVRHPTGAGALGSLPEVQFSGPAGELTNLGKGTVGATQQAANEWAKKHTPGKWGGGDANLKGVGGPVASQAAEIAKADHSPHVSTLALFEALWAESSMGASAPGNVLQALGPGGAPIGSAAEEISGFLTGHPRWTGTAAIPLAGSGLPANAIAQLVQASGVGEGNEGRANYLPQKGAALSSMAQFGLEAGGALAMTSGGKAKNKTKAKAPPLAKSLKGILKGLSAGKHLPKYHAALKKFGRRIEGIGLGDSRINRLGDMTKEVERFTEYASNASTLTTQDEEGNVTQGLFKGRNEGAWLNEQLGALLRLRNEVISAHGTVENKQLPRINQLMKQAKERLAAVRKAIREAEQKKRELEKQIKDIEKAQNASKHSLEKQLNQLETELQKAQGVKTPNKSQLESIRGQIHTTKDAISGNDKQATDKVHKIHEEVQAIEQAQKGRSRVETALNNTVIPDLKTKQEGMHSTLTDLFSSGGELKGGVSFVGLQQIQGLGSSTDLGIPNPPPIGSFGGEIFTVQNRLREINEEAEKAKIGGGSDDAKEIKELEKEIEFIKLQREKVQREQTPILNSFPSVKEIAQPPALPFAGKYAMGGVVATEVGERGREVVFAPEGARVIPSHEARAALAKGGNGDINFEEIHFHEAEGKVSGKANGAYFEQDVKKVNRKQSRKSMTRTPGGKGVRR